MNNLILATTQATKQASTNDVLQHLTHFLNTHTYIVELVIGILTLILIILFGLLAFFKEEIKLHAKNKKLVKQDSKRIKELQKYQQMIKNFENGLLTDQNGNKIDNHDIKTHDLKDEKNNVNYETLKTMKGLLDNAKN